MFEEISNYPTLTDAQRIQAQNDGQRNMVAKYARKPKREDFDDFAASRFPAWFTWLFGILLALVLLAGTWMSAVRLYKAGYDYAIAIFPHAVAVSVGVSTPLAAEFLVLVASVFMQIYLRGWGKLLAAIPIVLGTVVAFIGNWAITQPHTEWGWVETLFPPVAILSVGFFFEMALVPELERRKANENEYQRARAEYDLITNHPEKHPAWQNTYGLALWDMWRKVYGVEHGADLFDHPTRVQIVKREMSFDQFFDLSMPVNDRQRKATRAPVASLDPDLLALQGKERAVEWLKRNRDRIPRNQGEADEVGAEIGLSGRTVYRAKGIVTKNGHDSH